MRSPLYDELCSEEHLERALKRGTRGKRRHAEVAWFLFERERNLEELRRALLEERWRPRGYQLLYLRDPKPRVIARAPFADRLLHGALSLLLEPRILRSASEADLACKQGGGQHRALLRLLGWMQQHRFALHLDFRSYFPSLSLELLLAELARRFPERRLLALLEHVLESARGLYDAPEARRYARMDPDWPPTGRGLPMGSSLSQLLATHLHLQRFDHWVKRKLKIGSYLRYVDDLFLFADTRATLRAARAAIDEEIQSRLLLRLKHPRARILSCSGHLDALGHRLRRSGLEPLPATLRRWRARLAAFVAEANAPDARLRLYRSLASRAGDLFFG